MENWEMSTRALESSERKDLEKEVNLAMSYLKEVKLMSEF